MPEHELYPIAVEIRIYAALLLKFFNMALEERLRNYSEPIDSFQHSVLCMFQAETLTISEISQRLGMDPSTLVRMVDALEGKGLVERGSDPNDRRRNPIHITKKGTELVTAIPVISEQDPSFQALESLGVDSVKQFRDTLLAIIKQFPEGGALKCC